jgi:hypothetical protein
MAIYAFHKSGSEEAARSYLQGIMDRLDLNNPSRRSAVEFELEGYLRWCRTENPIVLARKLRVGMDIGAGLVLGGEVSRVDLDISDGGYRAILLGDTSPGWRNELRMPLLQRAVAGRMERGELDVRVGVQALDGSGLQTVRYSGSQIEDAMRRVREVATQVSRRLGAV